MSGPAQGERASAAVEKVQAARAAGRISEGGAANLTRWLTEAPYARYLPQLLPPIDDDAWDELDNLFWEVIPFGTGGRRGMMADVGSATINERTIAESADGLARYLKQHKGESGGRAAIACDTRNRSREFARLASTTLAAHGLKVFLFAAPRSTPELSFAVRHLACDVGVMITASHNPPPDNGFKAYWSNGAQVLPPHDKGIIDCVYRAGEIPTAGYDEAVADGRIELVGEELDFAYERAVLKLSLSDERSVAAVFTPLHGVGESSIYRVLREAEFEGVDLFEPHRRQDGNFPNVPDQLPNPERPEVFEPIFEEARAEGAAVILASDPDADRLGAVAADRDENFVYLTGNRIGALLTDYILRKRSAAGTLSPEHYVVETLVTTPLIGAIARAYGVRIIDDLLVGFKYIAETMDREGPEKFVFGCEESLGYLAGDYCRDKDAAVAALYLLELAAELRKAGRTLLDRLDELFCEHGYYVEGQRSEVCKGPRGKEQIDALLRAFRESPPDKLAGLPLARVRDYGRHEVRSLPDNRKVADLPEPQGSLMMFDSAEGPQRFTVAVRPSGTEPKIKFYFFLHAACEKPTMLPQVKQQADTLLQTIEDALSRWTQAVVAKS